MSDEGVELKRSCLVCSGSGVYEFEQDECCDRLTVSLGCCQRPIRRRYRKRCSCGAEDERCDFKSM